MYVYVDSDLVQRHEAVVSVFDHGFLYGDGVYETMRAYEGVLFMLDDHLSRLFRSASMIRLSVPKDRDHIKTALYETLAANSLRNAFVRLTVSRGHGPIGLDPDLCGKPTFLIIAEQMRDYPGSYYQHGIKTIIAETRRNSREAIDPRIKSLNFLNNILAKIEAKERDADESLMLNTRGHLSEGTISNLFFYKDGVLCTPSLECGILDGITRGVVLQLALKNGLIVREGEFTKGDISRANEVFITNSTMEVMPVSQVDGVLFPVGEVNRLLHRAYQEEVRAYVANVKGEGPSMWGYE
jgi:branched-chain amino acid aminotransferase